MGQAKRRTTKIRPKAAGSSMFGRIAGDVISGVAVDYVVWISVQHLVNMGYTVTELFDSLAGRTRFTHHFCSVFNCILQPTGSNEQRHIRQICRMVLNNCV